MSGAQPIKDYLIKHVPHFFSTKLDDPSGDDVDMSVKLVQWYKAHGNQMPSKSSQDPEEIHLYYWVQYAWKKYNPAGDLSRDLVHFIDLWRSQ